MKDSWRWVKHCRFVLLAEAVRAHVAEAHALEHELLPAVAGGAAHGGVHGGTGAAAGVGAHEGGEAGHVQPLGTGEQLTNLMASTKDKLVQEAGGPWVGWEHCST